MRRFFSGLLMYPAAIGLLFSSAWAQQDPPIWGMPYAELSASLQAGDLSAQAVVTAYLERIRAIDRQGPGLNSIIEVNPDAMSIALARDKALADSGPQGPLHGIPVILKANIDTGDKMATSAGSLALANHVAEKDAFLVKRLRDAGAIVLAKANLSEWANFRSSESSSGWSSLGGQTHNPYATDRNPCGSSSGSGVAVAARLAPISVGTETDGSIVCPAGINGIVGIKPTVGLISRQGIIPISATQDTAGPMALTVAAAARALQAMVGVDTSDAATAAQPSELQTYLPDPRILNLKGVRIGIWRDHFGGRQLHRVAAVVDRSVAVLEQLGAATVPDLSFDLSGVGDAEYEVLLYEFKHGLNAYLSQHNVPDEASNLASLIKFNEAHRSQVMPHFGQDIFVAAQAKGGLDEAQYHAALRASRDKVRSEIDRVMDQHRLDAIIAAVNAPAWKTDWVNGDHFLLSSSRLAAVSGYPSVAVPAGEVSGLPIGIALIGRAYSEARLIQIAHLFEQQIQARIEPKLD